MVSMKTWLLIPLITLSPLTFAAPKAVTPKAEPAEQLYIAANYEISVEDYDEKTDSFSVTMTKESAIGPNFVTPENLRQGIAFPGDLASFMRQKSQMMGSIYQLKKKMPLIREDEMDRRNKKAKAGR